MEEQCLQLAAQVTEEIRYVLSCARCGCDDSDDEVSSPAAFASSAAVQGWRVMGGEVCCPTCAHEAEGDDEMNERTCLKIVAPQWFTRPDFQRWRKSDAFIATLSGDSPDPQDQDVFVWWECPNDPLDDSLPADIAQEITATLARHNLDEAVLWIAAV